MINLLILIVTVLAIIAIIRVIRVLELANELSGEDVSVITKKDNQFNGIMMMVFLILGVGAMIYFTLDAKKYLLPISASKHGVIVDKLLDVNWILLIVVFLITQFLLFYFSYRYNHRKEKKAYFYPINHTLEFIWTIIPTIVLGGMIVYGLIVWNNITKPAPKGSMLIEIYGKQFDWTARYAGADNVLGKSNFRLIADNNPLGVDTTDAASRDDIITRELHLPVGSKILLKLQSRDVIHSAYLPHFRTQMNCVPGMTTEFFFEPTITTAQMKQITKNEKFAYVLLCNKICGVAHYNMKMDVVCEEPEQFKSWIVRQNFVVPRVVTPAVIPPATATAMTSTK
ncbi:MAG TPA: cytochrome c oxidase subunit II [Bacteroidia bacterium]|nr:cytochrome c oxidase subunit II [Bacteroidia bacterium]